MDRVSKVTSKLQFGRFLPKSGSVPQKEQIDPLKNEKGIYFSLADSSMTKSKYYALKDGARTYIIGEEVLQQYLISRRAILRSYAEQAKQGTLPADILDFEKHNQYTTSKENVSERELNPVFQYSVKVAKFTAGCLKNNRSDDGTPLKCYLAKVENKLQVGFVQFYDTSINEKKYIYIAELAVDPVYQGKGIGTQLINMVLGKPNETQAPYLVLTRSFNASAIGLYKKSGFVLIKGEDGAQLVTGCGYSPDRYIALVKKA